MRIVLNRSRWFEWFSAPKGEFRSVQIAVGFEGSVDPLSGMIVNLAQVDEWLEQVGQVLAREDREIMESVEQVARILAGKSQTIRLFEATAREGDRVAKWTPNGERTALIGWSQTRDSQGRARHGRIERWEDEGNRPFESIWFSTSGDEVWRMSVVSASAPGGTSRT